MNRIIKKNLTLNKDINNQILKRVLLIEKKKSHMTDVSEIYEYITKTLAKWIPSFHFHNDI